MSEAYLGTELPEDERQVVDLAREIAREELRPGAARRDEQEDEFDREVVDRLGDLGFLGLTTPPDYGGLGVSTLAYLCVLEELAWGDPSVAVSVSVHNSLPVKILLAHGTEDQKERWLPSLAEGDLLGAFSLSEAGAGSDAAGLTAQATPEGDEWVLTGEKMWVTNGASADLVLLFVRTDEPGDRRGVDGIGGFVVPTAASGWRPSKKEKKMGLRGSETVAVTLDELRLPSDHLVGEADRGFRYALEALNAGRLGIAAQALGIGQAALDHAVEYAAEREQFGSPIGEHQGIRFKLADMAADVAAARAITHRAARLVDEGSPEARRFASMAKLRASEVAMETARQAVQIFGGYGYMREYPVERLFRDAKVTEIYEGTSEIHRLIIGKQLFAERGLDQ